MSLILDFHTHRCDATEALISVDPRQFAPSPGLWYSVGFHPWSGVESLTEDDFALLERCASHPQVLAIGETGLDRLRGGELACQEAVFARHLWLAHRLDKPVVVHCVRTAQEILAVRRRLGLDHVTLAIHGLRGNEHVARTLLDAGCYLSFGTHFNEAALLATPLDRLLVETDESQADVINVVDAVARCMGLSSRQIIEQVTANIRRLLRLE